MKIIVAGAGHGGLTAAALLSAAGHDVSVLEKEKRENLGHDWEDRFTFEILREITGQEIPGQSRRYRGDSAFMTTPMNGMGIDLSLRAGQLLAKTVIEENSADSKALWKYNRDFHRLYGAETARNESLKNTLLNLPPQGVSFLFESGVVQAGDLAGAGRNTKPSVLLGKFVRGMKKPAYFFSVLGGLMKGAKLSKALAAAPEEFEKEKVSAWQNDVKSKVLPVKNEYRQIT